MFGEHVAVEPELVVELHQLQPLLELVGRRNAGCVDVIGDAELHELPSLPWQGNTTALSGRAEPAGPVVTDRNQADVRAPALQREIHAQLVAGPEAPAT
jgi:hypothetical protein